jgi:small subunit ribosomal protein S17
MSDDRGDRKVRTGRVVSDKMDKTVVVVVERRVRHHLYRKVLRRMAKYKAHDEQNQYQVGDLVSIMETRPISASKRWRVLELLSKRAVPETSPLEAIEAEVEQVVVAAAVVGAELEVVEAEAASEETPAEPEAEAVSEETPAEPEAEAVSEETPAEPEAKVASEETLAEPEAEVASEETPAEPEVDEKETEER